MTDALPSDDYLLGLKDGGMTQQQIADALGLTLGTVAGKLKRRRDALEEAGTEFPIIGELQQKTIIQLNEDGTQTSDRLVLMMEEECKNPRRLLELHNYDPDQWVIVDAVNNLWHMKESWRLGGGNALLYQSKIRVRPLGNKDFSMADIEKFLNALNGVEIPIYSPSNYDPDGEILEVCLADLHNGKRNVYDIVSIEEATKQVMEEIMLRIGDRKISKIYLVPLGDILHFDNTRKTTSGGTQLDTDGSTVHEIFEKALFMFIRIIESLRQIAPVEYIHIPGNHDYTLSYTFAMSLSMYFRNDSNVSFDCGHLPRKWRIMYNTLVGWSHGDISKQNASGWLMVEAREDWGKVKFAEVHAAHVHHQVTLEKNGMILRHVPSLNGTDEWHYHKGFVGAQKATMAFLYGRTGLREIWNVYAAPLA